MASTQDRLILNVVLIAIAIIFVFTMAVIIFFSAYRKRIYEQQCLQREKEQAYQKDLLATSIISQENERYRIAKELHDDIGAMLTTTKVYFEQLSIETTPEEAAQLTARVNHLLEDLIDSTRSISQNLSPVVLEKLGLIEALDSLLKTIAESGKIKTRFTFNRLPELSKEQGLNLYRIVQELIANTLKHANASMLQLDLDLRQDALVLTYTDNGRGIQQDLLKTKKGIGTKNIESRVSIVEGEIVYATNQDGSGLRVTIAVPLERNEVVPSSTPVL